MELKYVVNGTVAFSDLHCGDCFCLTYKPDKLYMLTDRENEEEDSCLFGCRMYVDLENGNTYYQTNDNEEVVLMDAKVVVAGRKDA